MAFFLQIGLLSVALIIFLIAYNGIRQGGSRVYSLEREAVLRRASATMFVGAAFMLAVIGWLYYDNPPPILQAEPEETATVAQTTTGADPAQGQAPAPATPEQGQTDFGQLPSIATVTLTPTLDPNLPTATPTPVIIRAFVKETGGNGLTLREAPGGDEILILDENEFVTVLQNEGTQEQGGFTWVKIRTFLGDEGWVAEFFLEIEGQ
ncbi:MAG: hypothetical protein AB8G95_07500 [Anaerolineae bacterium]